MIVVLLLALLPLVRALFGIIVRQSQHQGARAHFVGMTNYVFACLVSLGLALGRGVPTISPRTWQLGLAAGLVYALAYRALGAAVRRRGLAVASAVTQLSVAIPIACSMAIWGERPDGVQAAGIVLALAALTLLAADSSGADGPRTGRRFTTEGAEHAEVLSAVSAVGNGPLLALALPGALLLLALFLTQGGAGLAPKAFAELAPVGQTQVFLAILFGSAALSFLPDWLSSLRPRRLELLWGAALGAVNVGDNLLAVYALQRLPGILVFPVVTAGVLLLTGGLGLLAWKEPVGRWGRAGLAVALGAVLLVSLRR